VLIGHYLAVAGGEADGLPGIPTKEPAFGLPALWINESDFERAQSRGYMVVDVPTVIATHITELIKVHAWELLTRPEVQNMLDNVSKSYPKIVDELIPSQMTLGGVQRVLQNLLKERVPLNDIVTILETLLDYSPSVKDVEMLTEYVRQALSRYITKQHLAPDGSLYAMTLDQRFEAALSQSIEAGGAINPGVVTKLIKAVETAIAKDRSRGSVPVIICSAQVRRFLRKIIERFIPSVVILSSAEVASSAKLCTAGMVRYED
jgi:flagellar biosynthesis protein FlhA